MKKRVLLFVLVIVCVVPLFTACKDKVYEWDWDKMDPSTTRTTTPGESSVFAENGAYTWWTNMQAFRFVGEKDQTYLSYVDEEGNRCLASYNHETKEYNYGVLAQYEKDDHDSAGVQVLPDGRLLCVYVRHNKDKVIRWRITKNPEDITSFGEEYSISCKNFITYAQLHRISDTEYRIVYRYAMRRWSTRIYNCETNEWSKEHTWLTEKEKQYYLWTQEDRQEGKFNIFMTGHPKNGPDQNIRYGYFDAEGNIYTTGDKYVGDMDEELSITIVNPRHFDIVYEAQEGEHTRLYDVSYMGEKVGVLYGVTKDGEMDSSYYYAYYDEDAKKWVNNFICNSGDFLVEGNMYYGGMSFDKKNMQTVYVTRMVDNISRLEKWTTTDYGATWNTIIIDQAESEAVDILRPLIPYNAHDDIDVIYMKGNYPSYTGYDTDIYHYAD